MIWLLLIGVYFLGAATPCLAMVIWGLAVWAGLIQLSDNVPTCGMCGCKLSHTETWYCPECEPEWGDE